MLQPVRRLNEACCQQSDIEAQAPGILIDLFFGFGQQVQKQCGEPALLEDASHVPIPAAVPAAAAAMCEHDYAGCLGGNH
jgi:hypothetical protein